MFQGCPGAQAGAGRGHGQLRGPIGSNMDFTRVQMTVSATELLERYDSTTNKSHYSSERVFGARRASLLGAACIVALGICAQPAIADEAAADSDGSDIVVTATKRREEISKVPISVEAYNPEALEKSAIRSVSDLAQMTPGVQFDKSAGYYGGGALTNIAIRGINSSVGHSTTGIYIDDTPIQARATWISGFGNPLPLMFDVDHVEVDRGPQGTLFGAGAEGGALRFISPEPGLDHYTGMARTELSFTQGGSPSYEAGAALGGPIVNDKLGFRVSGWYRHDGGYIDRVDPFNLKTVQANSNFSDSYALRAAVTAAPTEWLKITPSIYFQKVNTNDSASYYEYLSDPSEGKFKNGRLLRQPNQDQFVLPSLKLEADLGGVTLTSVSSYLDRKGSVLADITSFYGAVTVGYGNPMGLAYPARQTDAAWKDVTTSLHQFTQEVRLSSSNPDAALKWTVGAFYSDSTQHDTHVSIDPYYSAYLGMDPYVSEFTGSLYSYDKQIAGFGQVDWEVVKGLTLTAGARIASTKSSFYQEQSGYWTGGLFPVSSGKNHEKPFTPKVGVTYHASPNLMLYASAGKGYRVGGTNIPIPLQTEEGGVGCPVPSQPASFKADSVWSYEAGLKGKLFGGRLGVDANAFHIDWNDIQQGVFIPTCGYTYTTNAGKAEVNGFNLTLNAKVTDAFKLGVSASYTGTRMKETIEQYGVILNTKGDVIGSPPWVNSPWDLRATAEYTFVLPGDIDGYLRAEDVFHSRNPGPFNSQNPASPVLYKPDIPANPATNQLNLRAGVNWQNVDIALFMTNALNAHPALGRFQDLVGSDLFTDTTFRPRTIGMSASKRF